jgi:hypothetical protein
MVRIELEPAAAGGKRRALPADVQAEVERVLSSAAEGTSVFMTGSIVEGFGNDHSDVDLYLVQDAGQPEQATAIGMRRSRYVDCEYFQARSWQRLAQRLGAFSWADLASRTLPPDPRGPPAT